MTRLLARLAIKPIQKGLQHGRWVEIRLGDRRRVTCSCGGSTDDRPHDFEQTLPLGACLHLVALYEGAVTEDKRRAIASTGTHFTKDFFVQDRTKPPMYFVRLSVKGREMFQPRWAAQALKSR